MRPRRPQDGGSIISLDSFLDIVTNTLGMLILVATLTVVTSRDVKISLGTPIMQPAPEGLQRVSFECRDNRVIPLDDDFAQDVREEILKSTAPIRQRVQKAKDFNRAVQTNGYHRFRFKTALGTRKTDGKAVVIPEIVVEPLGEPVGDTVSDLRKADGIYQARLRELDPKKHWLFFISRPDSFEALRLARKLAKQRGFQSGWKPKQRNKDIIFSPFGAETGTD